MVEQSAAARGGTRRRRRRLGGLWKRLAESRPVQLLAGNGLAFYVRFVRLTSRVVALEGPQRDNGIRFDGPVIIVSWHGQNFLMPALRHGDFRVFQLVSRHHDGEVIAIALRRLGIETIRGSAARERGQVIQRGGISGFLKLKSALKSGASVSLTADISRGEARRAGVGVVTLARVTGAPLVPVAIASSRKIVANSWDRAVFNLPFSRIAGVSGAPIHVPHDATDTDIEEARQRVEDELNRVWRRANELVERRPR